LDRVKLDSVMNVVNGQLQPAGYDCIEAEWSGNDRILRLFVDYQGQDEGITLDGCVKASRLLAEYPQLDDMIPGNYVLEVSSPGVERPLRRREHFASQVGRCVEVKLLEKVGERRNGRGTLLAVGDGDDGVLITLETEQGQWSFPLLSLQRASLVYDWGNN